MTVMTRKKRRSRGVSIGWKLAKYLLVFVALTLLAVWLFQILLLDVFFEKAKKRELQRTAQELSLALEREDLEMQARVFAAERATGVSIYRIDEKKAVQMISINSIGENNVWLINDEQLNKLYQKAVEQNGVYETKIAFGGKELENDRPGFLPPDRENYKDSRIHAKNIRLVYILLAESESGEQYLLLLDAHLLPLDVTVDTLKMQFWGITVILLIMAMLTCFSLYRRISKPLIRMNASAKKLAEGRYDVTFSGKGYRETRELAETLDYAASELSQLDRLQKELIANISHDLRTPLTMIRGYGEMMRDIPGENTAENMQLILDETERLSELVNDLLDISKLQAGENTPRPEEFDLTLALKEATVRYDAFTKRQGYAIHWSAEGSVIVNADRKMILQVFYNLINNAINYTGDDKQVWVRQAVKNNRVRISFTDTGDGIPKESVALIWDRYYKVDKVHRRATVGSGLGLSIVKEILDKHGASYGVTSAPGAGSTFWFELPVCNKKTQED